MPSEFVVMADVGGRQQKAPSRSSYAAQFVKWLRLKKYQYEVTFSLYMLTSTEKFIFNFIILTLASLLLMAAFLYLPNHISLISNRVWYYVMGELENITSSAGGSVGGLSQIVRKTQAIVTAQAASTAAQNAQHVVNEL